MDKRAEEGGGEANIFPVGVFRPEALGVPCGLPTNVPLSVEDESPLVGDGGGVVVAL